MRKLYVFLVRIHPRPFRTRFGAEMVEIFDQAGSLRARLQLVADGAVSVGRQWLARPEYWSEPDSPVAVERGVPVFYSFGDDRPDSHALFRGALASLVTFTVLSSLMGRGGIRERMSSLQLEESVAPIVRLATRVPFGGSSLADAPGYAGTLPAPPPAARETPGILDKLVNSLSQVFGRSAAPKNLGAGARAAVGMAAVSRRSLRAVENPEAVTAAQYFSAVAVLSAIDMNHDRIVTASELSGAAKALERLDGNADGWLSAVECGFVWGLGFGAGDFMRYHPALAAIDTNGDGKISSAERIDAATRLLSLDTDHDGRLTVPELIPTRR